jgi:tRNA (guanine6-N2)-methyltransferase
VLSTKPYPKRLVGRAPAESRQFSGLGDPPSGEARGQSSAASATSELRRCWTKNLRLQRAFASAARRDAGKPLRPGPGMYLAQTQPGFEIVAWEEIAARERAALEPHSRDSGSDITRLTSRFQAPSAREIGRRTVPNRVGMTIFTAPTPDPLRLLRASEDIFAIVGYRDGLVSEAAALERIATIARDARLVEQALDTRTRLTPGARSGHRLRYRVIARMAGDYKFRRVDLERAVSRAIAERGDHNWRLSPEKADVEFWATLLPSELILAIRLSDDRMRQRDYKIAHLAGSLRPSVAAALALLSEPSADDIVLDPFCGAGTVLIERAHLARYRLLIGCDRDPGALRAAQENIGPRYKPLELHPWETPALPLPDHSVSRIVTNLPWGIRHGSHLENRRLYPRILEEFHRLVSPGGSIVILTAETQLMSGLMARELFRPDKILRVSVLGAGAAVYVSNVPR